MKAVELVGETRMLVKRLNAAVREEQADMPLRDARFITGECREIEGWLQGIRDLLEA